MTDFTIENLAEDIDDAAPKFDMAPAVEAHFARSDLGAENGFAFIVVGAPFEGANDAEMIPNWWS